MFTVFMANPSPISCASRLARHLYTESVGFMFSNNDILRYLIMFILPRHYFFFSVATQRTYNSGFSVRSHGRGVGSDSAFLEQSTLTQEELDEILKVTTAFLYNSLFRLVSCYTILVI